MEEKLCRLFYPVTMMQARSGLNGSSAFRYQPTYRIALLKRKQVVLRLQEFFFKRMTTRMKYIKPRDDEFLLWDQIVWRLIS